MTMDGWHLANEHLDIIGYRGCNVPESSCWSIFRNGFGSKDLRSEDYGQPSGMVRYRTNPPDEQVFNPKAGDVHPDTAHCLSPLIDVGALFPNDTTITKTMIFICYVETGFNTYEHQQIQSWDLISQSEEILGANVVFGSAEKMRSLTWPLFAMEYATLRIPARHVLGAFSCTRTWASGNWKDGGTYRLGDCLYWNKMMIDDAVARGELTPGRVAAVEKAVLKRLAFRRDGVIPATPD